MKPPAIIVDLDGTLCNIEHRIDHFLHGSKNRFHSLMHKDTVNDWCVDLIYAISNTFTWQIIFVTGRSVKYIDETIKWIDENVEIHGINYRLYMRPIGEISRDSTVKVSIYKEHIEPEFDVRFVIEDRQHVVDAWRELGLVCLQCAKGDY